MTNIPTAKIKLEEDLFYFESDHLALRGNKDYSDVLKNLLILCAQRKKSIENYNKVVELKKAALEDPATVLKEIINGKSLGVPDILRIPELPVIDWAQYNTQLPENSLRQIYTDDNLNVKKNLDGSPKKDLKSRKKHWTIEEQKQLEELLQVYPPEPVELHRFKKIADALGNRTIQQVTSRVQKYFLKLYRAGLPIPGRIPKSAIRYRRGLPHKHQRNNHYLCKPTTFFPDLCVPVVMTDLDDAPGPSSKFQGNQTATTSSNYLISSTYHEELSNNDIYKKSEEEMQLELLKHIRKIKLKEQNDQNKSHFHHLGFKCDYCSEDPIIGTRWHCISCTMNSIDFCTDCVLAQMYSENCHSLKHRLIPFNDLDENENKSEQESSNRMETSESSDEDDEEHDDDENTSDVLQQKKEFSNNIFEDFNKFEDFNMNGFSHAYPTSSDLFDDIDNISKLFEKY